MTSAEAVITLRVLVSAVVLVLEDALVRERAF
jgi:hypothetical protein